MGYLGAVAAVSLHEPLHQAHSSVWRQGGAAAHLPKLPRGGHSLLHEANCVRRGCCDSMAKHVLCLETDLMQAAAVPFGLGIFWEGFHFIFIFNFSFPFSFCFPLFIYLFISRKSLQQ